MNINHRIVESLWTVWNTRYINSWQYTTKRQRYRPWKGWTQPRRCCPRFNSRPQKGATLVRRKRLTITRFQSTPPKGSDENSVAGWKGVLKFQSTPPKGSDRISLCSVQRLHCCFNPRPQKGATFTSGKSAVKLRVSIHAPKRVRRYFHSQTETAPGFNPRPQKGATISKFAHWYFMVVSIHAPKRERRRIRVDR